MDKDGVLRFERDGTVTACGVGVATDKRKRVKCPKCKCIKIIPIFYGCKPTDDALDKEARGEIKLVNGPTPRKSPQNYCKGCGKHFGRKFLDLAYFKQEEDGKWERLENTKGIDDMQIESLERAIRYTVDEEKRNALVKELAEYKAARIEYLEQSLDLKHVKDDPRWVKYLEKKIAGLRDGTE